MMSQHNPADYCTSKKPVCDNQESETYVQWHLSSYMTDKRMTFDEFIAEQRKLSWQPTKQVSTMNVVDQCGRADNMMCKSNQISQDYLLDHPKHYPEVVIDIKRNSIGTRPSSSQVTEYCPSLTVTLTPGRTTDPNSNIVLKAGITQRMLSIKNKFNINKIKSDDFTSVVDSVQESVKFDHASDELRSSPRNLISKIDKPTHCDCIADELSIDGLEGLGTGFKPGAGFKQHQGTFAFI
jgi:hypothetical protein